ncbi:MULTISPECIES: CidA/LrgA family protein [unclassified Devosia]|uniref:CidA/LrgA family protein n=1 Tax=unclassified Devosia TaxID=196773 RepID=UPI0020C1440E|nr:CidA/LrgA family protein [Devosia sp. MC521]
MPPIEEQPLKPGDYVAGFAILILCQLAGEVLVHAIRIVLPSFAFPGPVAGMLLLLALLPRLPKQRRSVMAVGNALLGILAMLFVPAAVGVMQYGDLVLAWGIPLVLALVVSTVLTLLATVGTFLLTEKLINRGKP